MGLGGFGGAGPEGPPNVTRRSRPGSATNRVRAPLFIFGTRGGRDAGRRHELRRYRKSLVGCSPCRAAPERPIRAPWPVRECANGDTWPSI
jgi:hypothetical protein